MKYEVVWSTEKVVQRAKIVMDYWTNVANGAKEKIAQLSQAEREDKTHNGASTKLKRIAEAAKSQAWRAHVLLTEAKDDEVRGGKMWTWTNDDLLWFYPDLANNEDYLLQIMM